MNDPRLTPANPHVAAAHLEGLVDAPRYSAGETREVAAPVLDLWDASGANRQRQVLRGAHLRVYDDHDGRSFVQSEKDGYVGYVHTADLRAPSAPTHIVAVPATHFYARPQVTCADAIWHSFGSRVQVVGDDGMFFTLEDGRYVPKLHLRPLNKPFTDPVTVAQLMFGVPYLWGGNSACGIDCSGLVQMALHVCHLPCPGDSDLQMNGLGETVAQGSAVQRGDLFFWKGHVAMAVDTETFIHANGYHMAVAYEPIADTIQRMEAQGDGPVLAHKRL